MTYVSMRILLAGKRVFAFCGKSIPSATCSFRITCISLEHISMTSSKNQLVSLVPSLVVGFAIGYISACLGPDIIAQVCRDDVEVSSSVWSDSISKQRGTLDKIIDPDLCTMHTTPHLPLTHTYIHIHTLKAHDTYLTWFSTEITSAEKLAMSSSAHIW